MSVRPEVKLSENPKVWAGFNIRVGLQKQSLANLGGRVLYKYIHVMLHTIYNLEQDVEFMYLF